MSSDQSSGNMFELAGFQVLNVKFIVERGLGQGGISREGGDNSPPCPAESFRVRSIRTISGYADPAPGS